MTGYRVRMGLRDPLQACNEELRMRSICKLAVPVRDHTPVGRAACDI